MKKTIKYALLVVMATMFVYSNVCLSGVVNYGFECGSSKYGNSVADDWCVPANTYSTDCDCLFGIYSLSPEIAYADADADIGNPESYNPYGLYDTQEGWWHEWEYIEGVDTYAQIITVISQVSPTLGALLTASAEVNLSDIMSIIQTDMIYEQYKLLWNYIPDLAYIQQYLSYISAYVDEVESALTYNNKTIGYYIYYLYSRISTYPSTISSRLYYSGYSAAYWLYQIANKTWELNGDFTAYNYSTVLSNINSFCSQIATGLVQLMYDDDGEYYFVSYLSQILDEIQSMEFGSTSYDYTSQLETIISLLQGNNTSLIQTLVNALIGDLSEYDFTSQIADMQTDLEGKYPFCIIAVLTSLVALFNVTPIEPTFDADLTLFGWSCPMDISFTYLSPALPVVHFVILLLFILSLASATRKYMFGGDLT